MTDELPEHRVPVTVFMTVRAVDRTDAGHVAEIALHQALAGPDWLDGELPTIEFRSVRATVPVEIHGIMDTATAAANGYLRVEPTSRIYRERA